MKCYNELNDIEKMQVWKEYIALMEKDENVDEFETFEEFNEVASWTNIEYDF